MYYIKADYQEFFQFQQFWTWHFISKLTVNIRWTVELPKKSWIIEKKDKSWVDFLKPSSGG